MKNYNLPSPPKIFVDREKEIVALDKFLGSGHGVISISGEGGSGKTTLALQFAHKVLEESHFDTIIWTTGKEKILQTRSTISSAFKPHIKRVGQKGARRKDKTWVETLDDLYYIIYRAYKEIDDKVKRKRKGSISKEEIQKWLYGEKLFIIVDDLDSWKNKDEIIRFLRTINPNSSSRALVTVRYEIGSSDLPGVATYPLEPLPDTDVERLFKFLLKQKKLRLLEKEKRELLDTANGNPLVLKLSIALLSAIQANPFYGYQDKLEVIKEFADSRQILEYLYENIIDNISKDGMDVLTAIAVLNKSLPDEANLEYLKTLTGLHREYLEKIINELQRASLINRRTDDNYLFDMHEMTNRYIESEKTETYNKYIGLAMEINQNE